MLYIVTESSMFDFFKGKKGKADKAEAKPEEITQEQPIVEEEPQKPTVEILPARKPGLFKRMQQGLSRTRGGLSRSEEHRSELQSRPHLVCRLLLEKKNTYTTLQQKK